MTVKAIVTITSTELNDGLLRLTCYAQIPPSSSDGCVVDLPVDATSGEINNAIIAAMKLRRETVFEEVFVEGDVIRLLNTVCPFDVPVVTEV